MPWTFWALGRLCVAFEIVVHIMVVLIYLKANKSIYFCLTWTFCFAVRIMYDKNSGRSRGFGFVHFSNDNEAKCAKDAMDGKVMLGRPLRISFALGRVRGASVIVPRLSTVRKNSNDVFVHFVPRNRSTPAISV
ncbi:hypothetical protein Zm00014a_043077 [Zea mays]|uniref:RRM domain-containing protein n=1 Tax=Zea mays TaxID=4577 RepID=A0A3L6DRA4_MAIZE|nr:hypothetical protein Zm00014a_043077 [Zea mays]